MGVERRSRDRSDGVTRLDYVLSMVEVGAPIPAHIYKWLREQAANDPAIAARAEEAAGIGNARRRIGEENYRKSMAEMKRYADRFAKGIKGA